MDDMRGHNNPPAPTPFEAAQTAIHDLYLEASNFCDGEPIETQAQADAVSKLIDQLRKASKHADETRAAEKKPFDDFAKAVQARYKPLLDKAQLAIDTAKKALVPFLRKIEAEKRRLAEEARREADEKAAAAREAAKVASITDNLADAYEARFRDDQAKEAAEHARAKEKNKAGAKGGARAMTLRTIKRASVSDYTAFSRYVWTTHRADLEEWLDGYAAQLCRAGVATIPGVEITTEQVAQ
jgi:hypothetical protein